MKNNHPKVLFFVTEDWFVCSHWLPLIIAARDAGYDTTVITQTNKHADQIRAHGIRVIPFEISRRGSNLFFEFMTVLRLFGIYHREQPQLVHHIAMKPMLYGSLVARFVGVTHIVNWVSGMGWLFVSNNRRAKILQSVVRKALGMLLRRTSVIVENRDDQAIISSLGIADNDIHLINGAGVDTLAYAPSPEPDGDKVVVLPARMLWDKGVGEFVAAAQQLRQRGVTARFVLVGEPDEGNPASVSPEQLLAWQKEGFVEWWGKREDMPLVYAQSHIVCLPSYREGLPKSLLEAASCARPIVTTNVPGCRDVVREGENGLLVEARDVTELANALARLLVDQALRIELGQHGRERVMNEFSQEKIIAQVLTLYREVLSCPEP